jgi:hypothetical protein
MGYPFAGFGGFIFHEDERAISETDSRWVREPKRDRSSPLGSARDTIVTLALGSADREFEILFEPTRFAAFEALVGTTDTFTDWTRPTPDSRSAYLARAQHLTDVSVVCADNSTRRKVRARVSLISQ